MKLKNVGLAEKKRIRLQKELDSKKTQLERNMLGQFATPPNLAQEIVNYIFEKKLFDKQMIRFLDPAVGTGSFFSALIKNFPEGKIESAIGIEIDRDFAKVADELWASYGLEVINSDFTHLNPPKDERELANLILTNPPYVRHHHIEKKEKMKLQRKIKSKIGYSINGLSGLYCYFLLLSHSWLKKEGYGIWLIPSEFMDVNYGTIIKKYLTEKVTLIHIHRFEPDDVQFADALVSSSIVIFQKKKPEKNGMATFSYGGNLLHPKISQLIPIGALKHSQKWTHIPNNTTFLDIDIEHETPRLGDFFKIQRGIATGANKFFIMQRTKAKSLGIPEKFLKPILPSPRNLKVEKIESDGWGNPILDDSLIVIDCELPENVVKKDYKQFYQYLKAGKESGITERYLLKKRFPWYKQEHRESPPFLCTYMGRNNNKNKPFRIIWNKSEAISTNVYLLMYPKDALAEMLNDNPELEQAVFEALKQIKTKDIMDNGRVYGGGLHKIEPKELGRLPANELVEILKQYDYQLPTQQKISSWV
ncbi:MAG: N-6 DNA methylase [Thermoplasmata archaeon]|nr:N-6 DNA methylase [Thermoplasmata archaeon]